MLVMIAATVTSNAAVADLVVSAAAVAVTFTVVFVDTTVAAANNPLLLIVPAAAGVDVHRAVVFELPVTVAPNWIVPPEPTALGRGLGLVIEIDTGEVTVSEAPVKLHPVASLGAVHPEPETVALPALAPVTVLPEIVTIPEGDEEKLPPVHPEGAEAMLVPPTVMVVGLSVTAPVGQLGGGLMFPPVVPPQAKKKPAAPHNTIKSKRFMRNPPCFRLIVAGHLFSPPVAYCLLPTAYCLPPLLDARAGRELAS
jgi:hypothetical protein